VRGQPAPDPPYEEIQFKDEILKVFQPFIEQKFLEQVTSGKNTNPNESYHSKASSQMGGKHTCKTQGGFYVGAMRAAMLRYSIRKSYSESVLDAVGVAVCETTKARNKQADTESASRRLYYKKLGTKRLRGKRVAKRKKEVWRQRNTEEEGYGKGMAMAASGDGGGDGDELKTEEDENRRERDAARARGDDEDEDMENADDDGAHGDDSSGEDEEPPEVVECLLCRGQEIAHDDYMLVCCDQRCLQAAHRSCSRDAGYETPRTMRTREAFLKAAKEWRCPACQYSDEVIHPVRVARVTRRGAFRRRFCSWFRRLLTRSAVTPHPGVSQRRNRRGRGGARLSTYTS